MKEVRLLRDRWQQEGLSFEEQNIIKDKLRYVQTRCNWIREAGHKQFVQNEIESLWQQILQTI